MKRKPDTPASSIRSALRALWLRSRERAAALKATGYTCANCGAKQSAAKGRRVRLEVHHVKPVNWDVIIRAVRRQLLVSPKKLRPLCPKCHKELHKKG